MHGHEIDFSLILILSILAVKTHYVQIVTQRGIRIVLLETGEPSDKKLKGSHFCINQFRFIRILFIKHFLITNCVDYIRKELSLSVVLVLLLPAEHLG